MKLLASKRLSGSPALREKGSWYLCMTAQLATVTGSDLLKFQVLGKLIELQVN